MKFVDLLEFARSSDPQDPLATGLWSMSNY